MAAEVEALSDEHGFDLEGLADGVVVIERRVELRATGMTADRQSTQTPVRSDPSRAFLLPTITDPRHRSSRGPGVRISGPFGPAPLAGVGGMLRPTRDNSN